MAKHKPDQLPASPLDAAQPADHAIRNNLDCYQEIASILWKKNVADPLHEHFSRRDAVHMASNVNLKNDDAMVAAYAGYENA